MKEYRKENFSNYLCVSVSTGFNLPNLIIPLHFNLKKIIMLESKEAYEKDFKKGLIQVFENRGINILKSLTFDNDKANNLELIDTLIDSSENIMWNITGGQKIHTFEIINIYNKRISRGKDDILVYQNRDFIEIIYRDNEGRNRVNRDEINVDLNLKEILGLNGFELVNSSKKEEINFGEYITPRKIKIFKENPDVRLLILMWVNTYFRKRELKNILKEKSDCFLEVFEELEHSKVSPVLKELNESIRNKIYRNIKGFSFIYRAFNEISERYEYKEREFLDEIKDDIINSLEKNKEDIVNMFKMDWSILIRSIKTLLNYKDDELHRLFKRKFKIGFSENKKNRLEEALNNMDIKVNFKRVENRYYIDKFEFSKQWGFFFEDIVFDEIINIIKTDNLLKEKLINTVYKNVEIKIKHSDQSNLEADILLITKSGQIIAFEIKSYKIEDKTLWAADNLLYKIGGPFKKFYFIIPWFEEYGSLDDYEDWVDGEYIKKTIDRMKNINAKLIIFSLNDRDFKQSLRKSILS